MIELFQQYSLGTIIGVLVLSAVAIKEVVTFMEWVWGKLKKQFNKETEIQDEHKKIYEDIQQHNKQIEMLIKNQGIMKDGMDKLQDSINLLLESDKDDIKSWITEKHHYFCYQKRCIDDYSLDCIERRYKHYLDEHGNSYIANLMEDIHQLPIVSITKMNEIDINLNKEN